jgi:SPP1 gp7 family putative phage head morphogenesis protein
VLRFKARRRQSPALKPQGELTASERRVAAIVSEAMEAVRRQVTSDLTRIADAVAHQSEARVADLVTDEPWYDMQAKLEAELLAELLDAGSRVELPAIQKASLEYSFDRERPESAAWARLEAAERVREITEGQRQTIRDVIAFGQVSGLSPQDTARQIQQTVGLTTQQAGWVNNFYSRAVSQNMAGGMSVEQAMRAADSSTARYQSQIHRYRATTIARTEIMSANSEGRQQAWGQGITGGWISPTSQKEWIAESDACDICAARNGQRHPVSKPWPGGEPPAHPNCRCDLLLIPDRVGAQPQPRGTFADALASLSSLLPAVANIGIDIATDISLQRIFMSLQEDRNARVTAVTDRRDFFARQGRPERAAVYDARSHQERTGLRSFTRTKRDSFSLSVDGQETRVKSLARYTGSDEITAIFEEAGISTPDVFELDPSEAGLFHRLIVAAKQSNKYGASVQDYPVDDYRLMRLFITDNGGAGFALKDGDELVSVFRGDTSLRGIADWLVHLGIEQGARRADAFDTVLPFIYGDHGLTVVARTGWNDEFQPPGWDKRVFAAFNNGEPDVVFMVLNAFDYMGYTPGMGMRFGIYDYDAAYEYAKTVLKWLTGLR